jgi:hypothetical protein
MGAVISYTVVTGNKAEFELSALNKGLYFVTITNSESIISRKFVVQ